MSYNLSFLFAALCVAVYAHERFNSPTLLRNTTTFGQYYMALSGYIASALSLFAIVSWALQANPQIYEFLASFAEIGGTVQEDLLKLPAPFVAALFLTILLPKIPVLKSIDTGIQRFFRSLGAIPHQALRLSWKLQKKPFAIPVSQTMELEERLSGLGRPSGFFSEAPAHSCEFHWAKLVSLKLSIEDAVGAHPRFAQGQDEAVTALEEGFDRQKEMAAIIYSGALAGERVKQQFHHDCKLLAKAMSEFIARGMLQTHPNLRSALVTLGDWGFRELDSDIEQFSFNQLAGLVLGVAFYLLVFFIVFGGGIGIDQSLKRASMIALIMGAAVACAILPRPMLENFARRDRSGHRPILFYMTASSAAAFFWVLIQFARQALEGTAPSAVATEVWQDRPWILMAMTTAFGTAWMADNLPERSRFPKGSLRWAEGAAMALVLAFTVALVQRWRLEIDQTGRATLASLPYFMASAGGLGFIIGYFVPSLYRRIPEERQRLCQESQEMQLIRPQHQTGAST